MFDRLRVRVSSAHVIAGVALFVALGGAAMALQSNSVKSKHIKNGQVKFADLQGVKAWNKRVPVSAESTSTGTALDNADVVTLAKRGNITMFGKCVRNTASDTVVGGTFARTGAPGAMYRTGAGLASLFNPGEPAAMPGFANAANNTINFADAEFDNVIILAANHRLALSAVVHVGAKNGSPAVGNGPFGAGDRCSFSGSLIG
jgi:hypothetical protein